MNGNTWFEKTIKKIQSRQLLSKKQIEIIIQEAIAYYLIESITFSLFLDIITEVRKKPETQTMPVIKKIVTQLNSLSKYRNKPQMHREQIIDTFNNVIVHILK